MTTSEIRHALKTSTHLLDLMEIAVADDQQRPRLHIIILPCEHLLEEMPLTQLTDPDYPPSPAAGTI